MHNHFLDSYSHLNGPLHRVPASLKLVASIAIIVMLVTIRPSPVLFAFAGFLLVLLTAVSGLPSGYVFKRMLFLEPFVLGASLLTLFGPHGATAFLTIATRSTLCLVVMLLLSNTTPFGELLDVLRRFRVPSIVVTTLALMYRYLYLLRDESIRMRHARSSRTFVNRPTLEWRNLASVIGVLFVRSGQRAERIYAAMCARGWK